MSKKDLYDDVGTLLKDLKSDIEDVLLDDVLDEVREIELEHVKNDVFDIYSPKIYKRRNRRGIDDPDNIIGEVKDMQLEVDNITQFDDDYGTYNHGLGLAELINDGEHRGGYYYDYMGEFTKPRPFLDRTEEEIERTDSVEDALAKGLKRRKYDVI